MNHFKLKYEIFLTVKHKLNKNSGKKIYPEPFHFGNYAVFIFSSVKLKRVDGKRLHFNTSCWFGFMWMAKCNPWCCLQGELMLLLDCCAPLRNIVWYRRPCQAVQSLVC
ncbi:hypothetical protein CHARACLAT_014918 [Characodon lateralis]|uniref:Uncharacterized protein n=1 Tax=Characodon lateralis TaxID=208331 RepID=A0ABU7D156_9TELE|nr:hypothetical protein [Characodon lateralis]